MSRKKILILAAITLVTMGAGGLVLVYAFETRNLPITFSTHNLVSQVIFGAAYGIVTAIIAWRIVSLPYLKDTRSFFAGLFSQGGLSWTDIIFISLCAGVGEEIFFRVFFQAYLGIWITSLVFVAIHGYLNPFNKPLSLYGLFMVFAIAGIGYMMEKQGVYSVMLAHTIIDVFLLGRLVKPKSVM